MPKTLAKKKKSIGFVHPLTVSYMYVCNVPQSCSPTSFHTPPGPGPQHTQPPNVLSSLEKYSLESNQCCLHDDCDFSKRLFI